MKAFARCAAILGFLLVILGGKLWLIQFAGSDLPTWDQWDSEGELTFRPWLENRLTAGAVFTPHAEHLIVTAKLYVLGLLAANGQWDTLVETTTNAVVHALSALVLLGVAERLLKGIWLAAAGTLLVLLFTLPFSSDNTLVGFQVVFYFLLLFSLCHLVFTLDSDRFSWRWGLGQLCAVLSLLSLASGFLSSVAVLGVLGFQGLRIRRWSAQQAVSAGLAAAVIVAGLLTRNHVPGHDFLKAQSAAAFFTSLLNILAWPGTAWFPWSLLLATPALVFVARRFSRKAGDGCDATLLGLLAWVWLQAIATAYARGGGGALTSRYLDLISIHVIVGFLCLARAFSGRRRVVLASLWAIVVLAGLVQENRRHWNDSLQETPARQRRREDNVRAYLLTNDAAHLTNKPFGDLPYPSGETLQQRLAVPVIAGIMPPSVRPPASIIPADAAALLPPGLRPLAGESLFSTWSESPRSPVLQWKSAVQPATSSRILRFRIAGDLGAPNASLRVAVKSASGTRYIEPEDSPGLRWKTVHVVRPPGEWWIEVSDMDAERWFALSNPVEIGPVRWIVGKLLKSHHTIAAAGVALLTIGSALTLVLHPTPPPQPALTPVRTSP